jgi:hypothetical protein
VSRALGAVAALALSGATPVEATHEMDHRDIVPGYVRDAAGRPLARAVRSATTRRNRRGATAGSARTCAIVRALRDAKRSV